MTTPRFHRLEPGSTLAEDWFPGTIPENLVVGADCRIDSSFCFKHYYSAAPIGLTIGDRVTIWRTALSVEEEGVLEIGDSCYLANASIVCSSRISLGARVMVSGGATIADSDFHPLGPAARLADTVALSPLGNRESRPAIDARPVIIEDDVWIGFNATVLKGVRVGARSYVAPGAVVVRDVPPDSIATGNPAVVRGATSS